MEFSGPCGRFSVQALATWMQALGTPLLVGLPALAAPDGGAGLRCCAADVVNPRLAASAGREGGEVTGGL